MNQLLNICFFFGCLRRKIKCGDCSKINVSVIYYLILTASYLMVPLSLITLKMTCVSMQKNKIFGITEVQIFFFLILYDRCKLKLLDKIRVFVRLFIFWVYFTSMNNIQKKDRFVTYHVTNVWNDLYECDSKCTKKIMICR